MSKIDNDRRYYPYYRSKNYNDRRYDDEDSRRQYKKNNKNYYQYSSSSRHDDDTLNNRNYNDFSYRRSHRHDYRHQHQSSNSHTYFSSSPPPSLMSCQIPPPPPPPAPPLLLTVVPHERESWIRSYLETMLRMPQQQKSLLNSTRFDRMRFANDQLLTSTTTTSTTANNDHLDDNSFHLIRDINDHDDIRTLEAILFNSEDQQHQNSSDECLEQKSLPTPPPSVIQCEPTAKATLGSGFLIDNCDDEELPPLSPSPRPLLPPPSSSDELIQQSEEDINEQRVMLVSELNAADAERRQELKHQKRLHKRLQQKKNKTKIEKQQRVESKPIPTAQDNDKQESSSDWILEYDMNGPNQVSQLTDEVRRTSITMTDEDKTAKVNMILMKIKKQQGELKKLRQYVMSMLGGEQEKRTLTKRQNSNIAQDLLMAFLNQPIKSGCWLCSGKAYAEVATQCDDSNEQ